MVAELRLEVLDLHPVIYAPRVDWIFECSRYVESNGQVSDTPLLLFAADFMANSDSWRKWFDLGVQMLVLNARGIGIPFLMSVCISAGGFMLAPKPVFILRNAERFPSRSLANTSASNTASEMIRTWPEFGINC